MKSHYFCPVCQSLEITLINSLMSAEQKASCKLCGWEGERTKLLATIGVERQNFWTGERVANVLLNVAAKHGAGPMIQALEYIGLVPPIRGAEQEIASAQHIRSEITKAVLEAVVTAAFERCAALTPAHFKRFDPALSVETEKIFSYSETVNA